MPLLMILFYGGMLLIDNYFDCKNTQYLKNIDDFCD